MIPKTLVEWDIPTIETLLIQGYWESDTFDFKEMLPHNKDKIKKERLYKSCCAFANTNGGFLIFGVSDDKALRPRDRLTGIDPNNDFPEHFGNYPANCVPSIQWEFRNPAIQLQNGKVLHVIYIPRSWNAPHAYGDHEKGWYFAKRTNKGNEGMSYEEVRLLFLGYYEKRVKLQLLIAELSNLKATAEENTIPTALAGVGFPLLKFDLTLLNTVLSDTYTILSSEQDLVPLLMRIRNSTQNANNVIGILHGIASSQKPIQNLESHNGRLASLYQSITTACAEAITILQRITSAP